MHPACPDSYLICVKGGFILIEVKNLVKRYGDNVAVDNLSFTVEKGQVYGFLGPNGAGKSTTMNIITGYLSSSEGTVVIDGHDIFEEPEKAKKSIGYLPEIPPLYPEMTVKEYLNFAADLKQVKKSEKKKMIQDIMELTKISNVQDRLIKNLSKGYRQRVGIAQAIVGYPEVLILDEPTVGLDPKQIIEIRDLIRKLSKNHTIILSSHIMQEISAVCDHILIISKGKLVACDTPDNLSREFAGDNVLEVTVACTPEQLKSALYDIEGIKEVSYRISELKDALDVTIKPEAGEDLRESIFYACAKNNCPIMKLQFKKMSLEDVFLELTQRDSVEDNIEEEEE